MTVLKAVIIANLGLYNSIKVVVAQPNLGPNVAMQKSKHFSSQAGHYTTRSRAIGYKF